MLILLTLAVVWFLVLYTLYTLRGPVWLRSVIGVIILVYGASSMASLAMSYSRHSQSMDVYEMHMAQSRTRANEALSTAPDSLRSTLLVVAAQMLSYRLDSVATSTGVGDWKTRWAYGILPKFDMDVFATNMISLAEVPGLLVWSVVEHSRIQDTYSDCVQNRVAEYVKYFSNTDNFIKLMYDTYRDVGIGVYILSGEVDPAIEDGSDPRSSVYKLNMQAARLVASLAKADAYVQLGCSAFPEELTMTTVRSYEIKEDTEQEWRPVSALLMDFEQLLSVRSGISHLAVRWLGDPERPVIGSTDIVIGLDVQTTGTWPMAESTWTDEDGSERPTYYVGFDTARLFLPGTFLIKWSNEMDLRSSFLGEFSKMKSLIGIPVRMVPKQYLMPPNSSGGER
jgi:hypothetical protein